MALFVQYFLSLGCITNANSNTKNNHVSMTGSIELLLINPAHRLMVQVM